MWAMGIVLLLSGCMVGLMVRYRKMQGHFRQELTEIQSLLEQSRQEYAREQTHYAQLEQQMQSLKQTLSEKESEIAALTAPPKPKLCIPQLEEIPPESDTPCMVYFNENTGIYHIDRACAPYQAIPMPLQDVIDHARPCKKCAEGRIPSPTPDQTPEEGTENQLCLFDLS